MKFKHTAWLISGLLWSVTCTAAQDWSGFRQDFLRAEKRVNPGQEADYVPLARGLKAYPLYPYLQYQWLKNHLQLDEAVVYFLSEYHQTRYAPLLRDKWLEKLGKAQQWSNVLRYYQPTNNIGVQCYFHQAEYQLGQQAAALSAARELWLSGKTQPDSCEPLLMRFEASIVGNTELVWQRFQASLQQDNAALATALIRRLSNPDDREFANAWLAIHQHPERLQDFSWPVQHPQAGLLFADGIEQLTGKQAAAAAALWDAQWQRFRIPALTLQRVEQQLGMALALSRDSRAYARLARLDTVDDSIGEWRVRAALQQQDWPQVEQAIARLSPAQQQQDKWRYWQARALAQTGRPSPANNLYMSLSRERSLYGFLAAAQINQPVAWQHRPVPVAPEDIDVFRQRDDVQMVEEFMAIGRDMEAKQQWWFVVSHLDNQGIMTAAKLAQQWHWPSIAIFTLAKAQYWDDMNLRFPLEYHEAVHHQAVRQQLNPALVFGLIRQETAFDATAQSPVGAKGLMQIMPQTGETIAQKLQTPWRGESSLFHPETNIQYGSFYYQQLLQQFQGNYALAAAAYNAGSQRVKRWLPTNQPMPGDIWVETIPYKETRGYVTSVLSYALIYQQRLGSQGLQAGDFLRDVQPG